PPTRRSSDLQYALGDVNLSLIKTARGRTIYVVHDTNLPRPYSRIHMVQGTRGLFQGYPNRIYIEGRSPSHRWEPADAYFEEFQHPLWEMIDDDKAQHGHGGMDYLRSEEHTSELQSRENLVCRLLL